MIKRFKDVLENISYEALEEAVKEHWAKTNVGFSKEGFRAFFDRLMKEEKKDSDYCFIFSNYEDYTFDDDDNPGKTEVWYDVSLVELLDVRKIYKKYGTDVFEKKYREDLERINVPYDPERGNRVIWFDSDIRPTSYSMIASPWDEILGTWMIIEKDETVSETAHKAALVLFEITFFGSTKEEREEEFKKLDESVKEFEDGTAKTYTLEEMRENLGLPEYKEPPEEEKRADFELNKRNVLASYESCRKFYFNLLEEGVLEEEN